MNTIRVLYSFHEPNVNNKTQTLRKRGVGVIGSESSTKKCKPSENFNLTYKTQTTGQRTTGGDGLCFNPDLKLRRAPDHGPQFNPDRARRIPAIPWQGRRGGGGGSRGVTIYRWDGPNFGGPEP